jgi:hypothetical protein
MSVPFGFTLLASAISIPPRGAATTAAAAHGKCWSSSRLIGAMPHGELRIKKARPRKEVWL